MAGDQHDDEDHSGGTEERFDRLIHIQEGQGKRLDGVCERLDRVNIRLDRLVDIQTTHGERLDRVNIRLDRLVDIQMTQGERLDRLVDIQTTHGERLDRLVEGQTRGFTAVVEAIGALVARQDNLLLGPFGARVREHGDAIGDLRERVARLEARTD